MIVPWPWQRGHGCDSANGPWLRATTPRPWHSGHTLGVVPGLAPLPWQVLAGVGLLDGTRTVDAVQRVVERHGDVGLQVVAALGAPAAAAAARRPRRRRTGCRGCRRGRPSSNCAPLCPGSNIRGSKPWKPPAPGRKPPPGPGPKAPEPAELVVLLALLGVGERLVGLADLLELLLRRLVARVLVGVVLARELAERLLDLVLRGVLGDAQRLVEVAPSPPALATMTLAGRSSLPCSR